MTTAQRARFDTVPAEARAFHGQPAGLVTRVLANLIDLLVVALAVVVAYLAWAGFLFLRRGADFTFPVVGYRAAYAAGVVLLVVYFTMSWAGNGRTYGDRLLGLRVRTMDDRELSGPRAAIRAVLCAMFPLLLVWVALSRQQRSVQDFAIGTHVVYDWGGSPRGSDDATRMAVDVAAPVPDEADDGHAEALPRVDGEG